MLRAGTAAQHALDNLMLAARGLSHTSMETTMKMAAPKATAKVAAKKGLL